MVTDYSSVYYDYLLCDKPIGLCFDDFEEYKQREGFTVDVDYILSGGEKLYNKDDFCAFIERISKGEDNLPDERREIRDLIHLHVDNKASERTVEHILSEL
jgi:CDP-glycerol glycerophosphotransferase (TagB/SpsB family)